MFFIFGMPRSGTTLLAQCLSAHSEIIVPHETDFIVPMAFIFDRIKQPTIGREFIYQLIIHSAAFEQSIAEYLNAEIIYEIIYNNDYHPAVILNALYGKIAELNHKKLAGDKSPNDLNFLRMLIKTGSISDDMKIIHIVRDIRDLMVSVNKTGWVSDLDLYFPRFWCNHNLYLNSLYREKANYSLIRYEDLVTSPEIEINKLCHFLGLEFEQTMLSPNHRHERYRGIEVHENLYKPISSHTIGKHVNLSEQLLKDYEIQAKEALTYFGYLK